MLDWHFAAYPKPPTYDYAHLKMHDNKQSLRGVSTPYVPTGSRHVFHQYTVRVPDGRRDALLDHLKERGIGTGVYYPVPIHQQAFYTQQCR